MKTATRYFGEIQYEQTDLFSFPKGLFGFEDETSFLLIPFPGNSTLLSLQSVSTPELAFVMMDPFALEPGYTPVLQPDELAYLGVQDSQELCYYVMCVVKTPVDASTVNLRCPVAINAATHAAIQVILEETTYHMRHPLSEFEHNEEEGEPSC